MLTFVIHTETPRSLEYADRAVRSFEGYSGWRPEKFVGLTPETLPLFEHTVLDLPERARSRAADFREQDPVRFRSKKSCSMNHYRLLKICFESDEPIAVVEHDARCVADWYNYVFDDVLVLNIESALEQETLAPLRSSMKPVRVGIHDVDIPGLQYRHDPAINGAHLMPGTAAYAVTPAGAAKLVGAYERDGWEQSDFMINTSVVRIQTVAPQLFTMDNNLGHSGGELS